MLQEKTMVADALAGINGELTRYGEMIAQTNVGVFNYFFTGTLNIVLIALCVLSLGWGLYSEVKFARKMKAQAAQAGE